MEFTLEFLLGECMHVCAYKTSTPVCGALMVNTSCVLLYTLFSRKGQWFFVDDYWEFDISLTRILNNKPVEIWN